MNDDMTLYDFTLAPSARRVRVFIAEKGLTIPTVQVDLGKDEQFSDDYRAINPNCLVPALRLADGTIIAESIAICRYLEALHPEPSLFGTTPLAQARIEEWQRRAEFDGLAHCRDVFRNKARALAGRALPGYSANVEQIPALVERGAFCLTHFFDQLDRQLGANEFVAGDAYSVADISVLMVTDFARRLKVGLAPEHTHVLRWYESVSARPSAQA